MYNFTFLINQLVKLDQKFLERKVFNCASWPGSVSVLPPRQNLCCFKTCFNKQKLLQNEEQEKESKKEKKEQTEQKKIKRLKI